jgi:hypothetical protein
VLPWAGLQATDCRYCEKLRANEEFEMGSLCEAEVLPFSRRRRPAFQPTEEQRRTVEVMVGLGIPEEDILLTVRDRNGKSISKNMLRKHFREELETAAVKMNAKVAIFMIATILGSKVPAGTTPIRDERVRLSLMELYLATRMGWCKTPFNQHEGKDGKRQIALKTSAMPRPTFKAL